jgi:tRNA pseudouridine13 synthase
VGSAGLKDRHAVTRQFLSFPPPVTAERLAGVAVQGIRILHATPHPHKLRTGHLVGNRFVLVVRDVCAGAAARAGAILDRLAAPPGCPNWYGRQRFGKDGDNARIGRELLFGQGSARGRKKRFLISAFQAELFNQYLQRRLEQGTLGTVLAGDVLQKVASGGLFVSTDPAVDQERLDRGELVVTGPMFGHKMKQATATTAELESQLLAAGGIALADFKAFGKLALGTRRPLTIQVAAPAVRAVDDDAIEVAFSLPSGAYATAVMREVLKGNEGFPA